jgi:hypothetical protein
VVVKHAFIKQYFIETEKKIINKQIKLTENTQYTFAHIVCILPVKKNCKKIFFYNQVGFWQYSNLLLYIISDNQ